MPPAPSLLLSPIFRPVLNSSKMYSLSNSPFLPSSADTLQQVRFFHLSPVSLLTYHFHMVSFTPPVPRKQHPCFPSFIYPNIMSTYSKSGMKLGTEIDWRIRLKQCYPWSFLVICILLILSTNNHWEKVYPKVVPSWTG